MSSDQFVIIIDGPIGVGKSTVLEWKPFCDNEHRRVYYLKENVNKWMNYSIGREEQINLLDHTKISPYIRQKYILKDLEDEFTRAIKGVENELSYPQRPVFVIERGIHGSKIFTDIDSDLMTTEEKNELNGLYKQSTHFANLVFIIHPFTPPNRVETRTHDKLLRQGFREKVWKAYDKYVKQNYSSENIVIVNRDNYEGDVERMVYTIANEFENRFFNSLEKKNVI